MLTLKQLWNDSDNICAQEVCETCPSSHEITFHAWFRLDIQWIQIRPQRRQKSRPLLSRDKMADQLAQSAIKTTKRNPLVLTESPLSDTSPRRWRKLADKSL